MAGAWNMRLRGDASRPVAVTAGVVLLVGAVIAAAIGIVLLREDALEEARRNIANLALVVAEHTSRSVQTIDLVLHDLQDTIAEMGVDSRDTFDRIAAGEVLRRELTEKIARLTHADAIIVASATGRIVNATRPSALGADISHRPFFRQVAESSESALMVSHPVESPATGEWTVYMARRIVAKDGTLLGVIMAALPIRYFEDVYRRFDLPRGEIFVLLRRDGTTLVRAPGPHRNVGMVIPPGARWHALVEAGGGFFNSRGLTDGVRRMVAVRPLHDYPLVINAAVAPSAVLETWNRRAFAGAIGLAFIIAYAAFLMGVTHRQFGRLKQSGTSLRAQNETLKQLSDDLVASREDLARRTRELEVTLETMDQGLMMIDADGTVVQCNAPARRLLDLPAELMDGKPTFHDVLRYQWETNGSGRGERSLERFIRRRDVRDRLVRQELKRPDGRVLEMRSVPLPGGGVVRTYTDITERKEAEDKVRYLAHHDDLTRLPNRVAFQERLDHALSISRASGRGAAVLYLDLDGFKQVNDTHGHEIGDRVLAESARRMQACVRAMDTVARFGGDEFAIVVPFLEDPAVAARLAERLVQRLSEPFAFDAVAASIGTSVGIALFPQDAASARELLQQADRALYEAKKAGRGTYRFHGLPEQATQKSA
jgi:diguanylate cyclase (GGDEF)-like protein